MRLLLPLRPTHWLAGRALIVAAALVATLAGCAPGVATQTLPPRATVVVASVSYPQQSSPGYGTLHIQAINPGDGSVRWRYQTDWHPFHVTAAPTVVNGIVYVESDTLPKDPANAVPEGKLIALSENDGHTLWAFPTGFLAATPVVINGLVYTSGISLNSAKQSVTSFYAIRADNGQQVWKTGVTDNRAAGAPPDQGFGVIDDIQEADGTLYIRSNQICLDQCSAAYILALRERDGKQLWKLTIPGDLTIQPPVIAGDSLYVFVPGVFDEATNAMGPSDLVAYNASDGGVRWKAPMVADGPIVVAHGLVYANSVIRDEPANPDTTFTMRAVALDAATGATRWTFTGSSKSGDSLLPLLAVSPDMVFAQSAALVSGALAYTLDGLDPATGAVRWRRPLPYALGATKLDGATLYAFSNLTQGASGAFERQATLMAFPASGGPPLWTATLTPAPRGDISVVIVQPAGGQLYAAYYSNTLSDITTQNDAEGGGSLRWSVAAPGTLRGVTVTP